MGGERNWKFSLEEEVIIQEQFWFNYENDKYKSINAHSKELTNQFGVVIPPHWVRSIFQRAGFTYKFGCYHNKYKFLLKIWNITTNILIKF